MDRLWIKLAFCAMLFLISCEQETTFDENYVNAYRDILIVRELFSDTAQANPKVRDIIKKYGYNEATFARKFQELANQNDKFIIFLDSLKQSVSSIEYDSTKFRFD